MNARILKNGLHITRIEDINSDSHEDIAEKYNVPVFYIEDILPFEIFFF